MHAVKCELVVITIVLIS